MGDIVPLVLARAVKRGFLISKDALDRLTAVDELDVDADGFSWIDCENEALSTISYIRRARNGGFVVVLLNFTPVPRENYRVGVPLDGSYQELFNSDAVCYGGSNIGNHGMIKSQPVAWMEQANSLEITLPPLAGLILQVQ